MAIGPGVYEAECTRVLRETDATLVLLGVVHGSRGNGFSVAYTNPDALRVMPRVLRKIADQIERDQRHSSHARRGATAD